MVTDIVGKKVSVGDTIALATRVGNSAGLKVRQVVGFQALYLYERSLVRVRNPDTGRTAWALTSNIVLLDKGSSDD